MESAATRLPRSVSYASTKSASLSNHSSEIPFLDLSIVSSLSCSRAYLPLPSMVLVAAGKPRRLVASLRRSYASIESWRRGRFVDAAGIVRKTARRHDDLLAMLFVAEEVPAWHSNRLNRLTRSPKRYLTESALVGPLLGVDERAVIRNGDLLGRLIDTFVMQQLRPEVEMSACAPRLHHLRHEGGDREIDIIAELADGRVIGIEVKASSAPKPDEARHLVWLREQLGDQVAACVLLPTGPTAYTIVPGVQALPSPACGTQSPAARSADRGHDVVNPRCLGDVILSVDVLALCWCPL